MLLDLPKCPLSICTSMPAFTCKMLVNSFAGNANFMTWLSRVAINYVIQLCSCSSPLPSCTYGGVLQINNNSSSHSTLQRATLNNWSYIEAWQRYRLWLSPDGEDSAASDFIVSMQDNQNSILIIIQRKSLLLMIQVYTQR